MDEGDKEIIALLTKIQATGGGGGAACMGNASTSDVALGMTFSNSNGKNLIGTSTDNATVPISSPFLPAQAFVDNITTFATAGFAAARGTVAFTLTNISTVSLSPDAPDLDGGAGDSVIAGAIAAADIGPAITFNFSACPIVAASINGIMAMLANNGNSWGAVTQSNFTFIMNGLCAAPTGQGITDKATAIGLGFNITTN